MYAASAMGIYTRMHAAMWFFYPFHKLAILRFAAHSVFCLVREVLNKSTAAGRQLLPISSELP